MIYGLWRGLWVYESRIYDARLHGILKIIYGVTEYRMYLNNIKSKTILKK